MAEESERADHALGEATHGSQTLPASFGDREMHHLQASFAVFFWDTTGTHRYESGNKKPA